MEYSFVFLGDRNKNKILEDLSSKITLTPDSYQVIFLTNKNPSKKELPKINKQINCRTIVFESATSEQMFETILQKENLGTVIFFKESAVNINFHDVNRMLDLNTRNSLLVVSKQKKKENFLSKIIHLFRKFFARIFLGVTLFESDADIILLDKVLTSTMTEMPGRSAALTKVNGWAGIEPKYVSIEEQPKEKKQIPARQFVPVAVLSSVFLLLIIGDILFGVLNVELPFLVLFLYIIIQIAVLAFLAYTITKVIFRLKFGSLSNVFPADIVKEINNFND